MWPTFPPLEKHYNSVTLFGGCESHKQSHFLIEPQSSMEAVVVDNPHGKQFMGGEKKSFSHSILYLGGVEVHLFQHTVVLSAFKWKNKNSSAGSCNCTAVIILDDDTESKSYFNDGAFIFECTTRSARSQWTHSHKQFHEGQCNSFQLDPRSVPTITHNN